jgi:hypothetical protein
MSLDTDAAERERNRFVAEAIGEGKCPFGQLQDGQVMAQCPLGFPGCGCADELLLNPYLSMEVPSSD